jgi:isoleucyl-tRNA synthetase
LNDYAQFEFHPVVAKLQTFCSEDLGAFYLDILKDRLYTTGADSQARRSAQTVLWHITRVLLKLMAPILSFTAEEAWPYLPGAAKPIDGIRTIFTEIHESPPQSSDAAALQEKWALLREVRSAVTKAMEAQREQGAIGSSLQAQIHIHAPAAIQQALASLGDELKFVLITSQASVDAQLSEELTVSVRATEHPKCERCWHYEADVGQHPDHPGLCGRCVSNLEGPGESRRFA